MRHSPVVLVVVLLLGSFEGRAEGPLPLVAPFTLEVKRTPKVFSNEAKVELGVLWPMLVRAADAAVPEGAKLSSAMADLKRQDCDREDECLTLLAKLAGANYGLYASIDFTTQQHVVAVGRVVRRDGVPMGPAQTVDLFKAGGVFKEVAVAALTELLVKLGVGKLSAFVPVAVPSGPTVAGDVPPFPPPPLIVEDPGAGQRAMGNGTLYVGAGVAVVGGVLAGVGAGLGYTAARDGDHFGSTAAAQQAATGRTLATVGFIGLGAGAVTAAVGAILRVTARSPPTTQLSVVPVAGGGVFQVGGRF